MRDDSQYKLEAKARVLDESNRASLNLAALREFELYGPGGKREDAQPFRKVAGYVPLKKKLRRQLGGRP